MEFCVVCSSEIVQPPGSGRRRRFCSKQCKDAIYYARQIVSRQRSTAVCGHCGKPAAKSKAGLSLKYCSPECRIRSGRKQRVEPSERKCGVCKRRFTARHPGTKYCSQSCKSRAKYIRDQRNKNRNSPAKRCERWGIDYQFIDPQKVFQRDGFICQICLSPIDQDSVFPDPLAGTVDHIVPLAKGGEHNYENVQTAHWGCNSAKRDQTEEEFYAKRQATKTDC